MTDVMRARVGSFVFDGGGGDVLYSIEKITGLDGLDMRRERMERPIGHGEFRAPGYLNGRVVTIEGRCHTSSAEQQDHEMARFGGLLAGGAWEQFVFDLPSRQVWAEFGRYSKPRFEPEVFGSLAQYQLTVYSEDAFLYGETHEFNGNNGVTFPVWQYGNTEAEPECVVIGNTGASYTIEALGMSFAVSQNLEPGHPHHVFPASGQLVIDDEVIAGGIVSAPVITVPSGVPTNFRLVCPDLSNLQVIVRDTYA